MPRLASLRSSRMRSSPSSGSTRSAVPSVLALSTTTISHGRPAPRAVASRSPRPRCPPPRCRRGRRPRARPRACAGSIRARSARLARSCRERAPSAAGPAPAARAARRALTAAALRPELPCRRRPRRPLPLRRVRHRAPAGAAGRRRPARPLPRHADPAYLAEEAGRRATARRLLASAERHVRPAPPPGGGLRPRAPAGRGAPAGLGGHGPRAVRGRRHACPRRARPRRPPGADRDARSRGGRPLRRRRARRRLEHLEDPLRALRACAALLAPGGALLVVTPDPSAAVARLAGRRWWGFLPAHTHLIPRRTLRTALAREGLEPVDETGLWRTFSLGYWAAGLGERVGPGDGGRRGGRAGAAAARIPVTLSLGDERVIVARPAPS